MTDFPNEIPEVFLFKCILLVSKLDKIFSHLTERLCISPTYLR